MSRLLFCDPSSIYLCIFIAQLMVTEADIGFVTISSLVQYAMVLCRDEFVSLVDHCKYKYLLNWPGHSYSARLKALLQCGSAVVYPSNDW